MARLATSVLRDLCSRLLCLDLQYFLYSHCLACRFDRVPKKKKKIQNCHSTNVLLNLGKKGLGGVGLRTIAGSRMNSAYISSDMPRHLSTTKPDSLRYGRPCVPSLSQPLPSKLALLLGD